MTPTSSGTQDRSSLIKTALFCAAFLGYIVPLLMPLFVRDIARELAIDVSQVGFLAGLQGLVVGLASLVVGPMSDRHGRKVILWRALLLNGIALIVFANAWNVWSLYAFGLLIAVTFSPLVFCSLAYIADYFPVEKRGSIVGLVGASLWGALIIGTPIAVLLMKVPELGWRSVFVTIGIFSFMVSLLIALGLRSIASANAKNAISPRAILTRYLSFLRTPRLSGFLAIIFLLRVGAGMYVIYGTAYLFVTRSFPPEGFITAYPIGGAIAMVTSMYAGKLTDRLGARPLIVLASFGMIAAILMMVHLPTTPINIIWIMGLVWTLYMISESFRMTALQTEAVSKVPIETRGSFMGAFSFLMNLGYAVGGVIGGIVLVAFKGIGSEAQYLDAGFTTIVYITAVLWFLGMLLAVYYTGSIRFRERTGGVQAVS
jgi:predicted MFS family arabinose efflux permease